MLKICLIAAIVSLITSLLQKEGMIKKAIITFFVIAGYLYFATPALTGPFNGYDKIFLIGLALNLAMLLKSKEELDSEEKEIRFAIRVIAYIVITGGLLLTMTGAYVSYGKFFRSDSYKNMIGEVSQVKWEDELVEVSSDVTQVRVLSEDMARKRAARVLSQGSLGSSYHIGKGSVQKIGDRIEFVAVLRYNSFFQWFTQKVIPGYISVDVQDEFAAAKDLVKQEIVYAPSAFFSKDLKRHLWMNGYASYNINELNFELDDDAKGYWVATISKPTIGWNADKYEGVAIVEPTTGEISFYKMDEIPSWVDRVIPEDTFKERVNWAGKLKNGYLASIGLGNKLGLFETSSSDVWMTWNKDGEAKWFVSCKNCSGADDALASIYQMDTRTGKVTFFTLGGAPINDRAAKQKAEGLVSDFGWGAENPILYTVNGEPTWVATLTMAETYGNGYTRSTGEYQGVACINYEKEIRTYNRDKMDAVSDYSLLLAKNTSSDSVKVMQEQEGVVACINQVVTSGESYFIFKLEGNDTIFQAKYVDEPKVAFIKEGDKISFTSNALVSNTDTVSALEIKVK